VTTVCKHTPKYSAYNAQASYLPLQSVCPSVCPPSSAETT